MTTASRKDKKSSYAITHVKVEDFTGNHHGEELLGGRGKGGADGLPDSHGDISDTLYLSLRLLSDFVGA